MKTLIAGGLVYDGTGAAAEKLDVLIENGRIAEMRPGIAENLAASPAKEVETIDATGMAVTPGFIDMHRHCDIAPMRDEDFGLLELSQGIVATVVGNCGLAPVPVAPARRQECCDFLEPVVGHIGEGLAYPDYAAYFRALKAAKPAISMGVLAGTGAIKTAVKGFCDTPYTPGELAQAAAHVQAAMDEGALGVSLGFMYQPECYTTPEEQVAVIRPAAKAGGLLTTHIRGEGDSLVPSVREVIGIAREAEIKLHISHFKATGIRNWGKLILQAIQCIEDARAKGMDVTADFYPYAGGSTTLLSLIPPSALAGGGDATLRLLATADGKALLRREIYKTHPGWDNMALSIGWDRILIASTGKPAHAGYGGRDIQALADENGYADPSDFVCDLLVDEGGQVGIVVLSMSQDDVDTVARLPYTALISDALYGGGSNPHPRLYGSFPRFIRDYVLGRGILPMQTAIHKMTGMPAGYLKLAGRGLLRPGYTADVCLFDPAKLADHAEYTNSRRLSTGMGLVLMGGVPVFEDEHLLQRHQGTVLLRGK